MKQCRLLVNIIITVLLIINKCGISFVTIDKNDKLDLLIVENLSIVSNRDVSPDSMKSTQLTAIKELLLSNTIIVQKLQDLESKISDLRMGPMLQPTPLPSVANKTAVDDKAAAAAPAPVPPNTEDKNLNPDDKNREEAKNREESKEKNLSRNTGNLNDKKEKKILNINLPKDKYSHFNSNSPVRLMKDQQIDKNVFPMRHNYMLVGDSLSRQIAEGEDRNDLENVWKQFRK